MVFSIWYQSVEISEYIYIYIYFSFLIGTYYRRIIYACSSVLVQIIMANFGANTSLTEQWNQSSSIDHSAFQLNNNDHPGVWIVTAQLSCNNYLTWSSSIQISLGAKDKLGFIDRTIKKPSEDSADCWFSEMERADYMVRSWILGSLTKELAESFFYCPTTKTLWDELEERFGVGNEPKFTKYKDKSMQSSKVIIVLLFTTTN